MNYFLNFKLLLFVSYVNAFRNVLFLVVDDLRPTLGVYNKKIFTPHINRLAEESTVFLNAYSQFALCAPSRNSLLTSRRPDTLRLYDFYSYWRTFSGNFTTLPQYLRNNGIDTKSIGKVFHPGISSNNTDDMEYSWTFPPWHPITEKFKNVCLTENGTQSNIVCPVRIEEQPYKTLPDIESTNEAVKFLKNRKGNPKPFFLAVGFHKPHIPLKFPREFLDLYPIDTIDLPIFKMIPPGLPEVAWNPWSDVRLRNDIQKLNLTFPFEIMPDQWIKKIRQSYYACVSYVDSLIGRILKALKQYSFEKNTIIVLVGDHGWSLGEHGEWAKYSNFEAALRVPFILKVPNLTKQLNKETSIVELVDIFPTLVDLLGLKSVDNCPKVSRNVTLCTEGKSLLSLLIGKKSNWKNVAFAQYPRPTSFPSLHPNSDKPKLKDIKIMGYSVRTSQYRYTIWVEWDLTRFSPNWSKVYGIELYDHFFDAGENLNLSGRPGLEELEYSMQLLLKRQFSSPSLQQL